MSDLFANYDALKSLKDRKSRRLRFTEPYESDFKSWNLAKYTDKAHYVLYIMCGIWALFLCADLFRLSFGQQVYRGSDMLTLVLSIRVPILVTLLAILVCVKRTQIKLQKTHLIMASYVVLTLATAIISNIYHEHGEYKSAWIPLVLMVPIFTLPIGMIFRQSLLLAFSVFFCLAFCYYIMLHNIEGSEFGAFFFSLVICLSSAGFGGFFQEKNARETFLAIQMLQLKSSTDPMTELGNRRYFNKMGKQLIGDAHRHKTSLCFAVIDIDNFKTINDTYGHSFGDNILLQFADRIRGISRRSLDIGIRLGGEEFGILFNNTSLDDAHKLVEGLRKNIIDAVFKADNKNDETLCVTFSAAVVQLMPTESLEQMYKRADELMYQAKEAGRNRVIRG